MLSLGKSKLRDHLTPLKFKMDPKNCSLFLGFNPPKEGPFQSKQGSFGFYVYIHIYICQIIVIHPPAKPWNTAQGRIPRITLTFLKGDVV